MVGIGNIADFLSNVIDKIFPDKEKANEVKLKMLELEQQGELTELVKRYEAIVAEAQSLDKWTSRARPSFMYVFYLLLLTGLPMGIVFAISPETASNIIEGFGGWFKALPEELYWLFGSGYLGYTTARTWEKQKGLAK